MAQRSLEIFSHEQVYDSGLIESMELTEDMTALNGYDGLFYRVDPMDIDDIADQSILEDAEALDTFYSTMFIYRTDAIDADSIADTEMMEDLDTTGVVGVYRLAPGDVEGPAQLEAVLRVEVIDFDSETCP